MLSIFLALLIHFLGGTAGAATHAAVQAPATPVTGHMHSFDSAGGPPD